MTTAQSHQDGQRSATLLVLLALASAGAPLAFAQHEKHPAPPPLPAKSEGQPDDATEVSSGRAAMDQGLDHAMNHGMQMRGFLGPYPMTREASGTSWQPDSTPIGGFHFVKGSWMLMVHAFADIVYDDQGGPRGESKVYGPNMGMLMGSHSAGRGTLGLRTMLSLDPATVGKHGYPLLLQTGETADGRTPLIDRQHPHDLFMELAATYSIPFGGGSAFGYLGYPGEPALGPPTFMHRFSGTTLPETPIMHHWLDSTHITFGVATIGATWNGWKAEASSFTGREPDESRWNFDKPRFDSYSGRLSFNASKSWALQLSGGHLNSPEQLEPEIDVDRYTAGFSYNRTMGSANWQTSATWGRNRKHGVNQDGVLLESTWWSGASHTVFGRAELVKKAELFGSGPLAHAMFNVGKVSAGYVYDVSAWSHFTFGVGALGSVYRIPGALRATYGDYPVSLMVFVRSVVR
jgi:hypothetical protein